LVGLFARRCGAMLPAFDEAMHTITTGHYSRGIPMTLTPIARDRIARLCAASCVLAAASLSAAPTATAQTPPGLATIPVDPLRSDAPPTNNKDLFGAGKSSITWGGFVKVDALLSSFSQGDALNSAGRDFYVPASIPVGSGSNSHETSFDAHAKETRLFVKADTDFGNGLAVTGYIEFDFLASPGAGTPNVTNAYNPALRRAYLNWERWLIGQDWTTFQDLAALPEGLDFVGPTEGTPFGRQPLLRYTRGSLSVALENAETTILPNGGGGAALSNDNVIPDLVLRYTFRSDAGQLSLAGLLRQLRSDAGDVDDDVVAGGISVMGKLTLGNGDDLRFSVATGEGIGRYVGINTIADAVVLADNSLDAIGLSGGYIAYRHLWNNQWRSTLTLSALKADTTVSMGGAATDQVHSVHLNLLYSPVPRITLGAELMRAEREVASGEDGTLDRLQFSAKYAF
jgi:hypothetical protein